MPRISTGSPLTARLAYSRAAVRGDRCFMSSVTGYNYCTMTMPQNAARQAPDRIRPAAAMVVAGPIGLDMKIEIEMTAFRG